MSHVTAPQSLDFKARDAAEVRSKVVLIGDSPLMREARALLEKIARSPARALVISGERGVGKDVAARTVHDLSDRAQAPFDTLACTGTPDDALERKLFGVDGERKRALLDEISGGTLVLDEVTDLSFALQERLLRLLEDQAFQRVGSAASVRVDVRIIACTQRNLHAEVAAGRFREDLYYRLCVLHVSLPPLSAREGDVELLSKHFVKGFSKAAGKSVRGLAADALSLLIRQPWPGNVRELKHVIEGAIMLTDGPLVRASDITLPERTVHDSLLMLPSEGIDLAALERDLLRQALDRVQGNKTRAGALLGLTRDQVRHRVAKLGPLTAVESGDEP